MSQGSSPNGVIVAENDPQMRGLIRSVLMHAKQLVFPVADGAEALQMARNSKPRLVLLDIAMPRLNGLETCKALRGLPGFSKVPIVMLTGYSETRFVKSALELGANDFISKPFRPNILLTRLAAWLDIPLSLLATAPVASLAGDIELGAGAAIWKSGGKRPGTEADNAEDVGGREILRILRAASRGY